MRHGPIPSVLDRTSHPAFAVERKGLAILDVNQAGLSMLGLSRRGIEAVSLRDNVAPDQSGPFVEALEKAFSAPPPPIDSAGIWSCRSASGQFVPMEFLWRPVARWGGRRVIILLREAPEEVPAVRGAAPHARHPDLGTWVLDRMAEAVVFMDDRLRVSFWNPAAERLLGVPAASALGRPLEEVLAECGLGESDWPRALASLPEVGCWKEKAVRQRGTAEQVHLEATITRPSGRSRGSAEYVMICGDATDRNLAWSLARRLVGLQEAERREIGRELHDEVGQLLTGLKLTLEASASSGAPLRERAQAARHRSRTATARIRETHAASVERIREMRALVDDLFSRVRTISVNLRPAMLDDLGLLPALSAHVERYTRQTGIRVDLRHSGLGRRFPGQVENAAFRVVQEALTNVARHAAASDADVLVLARDGATRIVVEDRGRGFDRPPPARAPRRGSAACGRGSGSWTARSGSSRRRAGAPASRPRSRWPRSRQGAAGEGAPEAPPPPGRRPRGPAAGPQGAPRVLP